MRKRGQRKEPKPIKLHIPDFESETPIDLRRRTGKRKKLSVEEKINIVHQVIIGHEKQADVAKEY